MAMSETHNYEQHRLAALAEIEVLDTPPSPELDAIVKAAASVCDTPISLISLVDQDRQWFKANVGLEDISQTPRSVSFCAHAIENEGIFEIKDASIDPRFLDNPLVTEKPSIRFYAGVTLRLSNGAHVGTLCVIDQKARKLTARQRETLQHLSTVVVHALETIHVTRRLASSEAKFRALTKAAPLGIFSTDADGACTYTNERWQTIFNMEHNEAMGHGWSYMFHPEDKDHVISEWTHAATKNCDFDMECRIQHPDGKVVNVRMISRPIVTQQGEIVGHVGCVEDVSGHFTVQRTLFEERRRLKSIIEGTAAGTWEWNIQTGEMRFNSRWTDMLGTTLTEMEPTTIQTWYGLAHPDDTIRFDKLLDEHLTGSKDTLDCDVRMRHKAGDWVWVHIRGRVITRLTDGRPEWMFGTQLDITERRQQEQALLKSESLLAATGTLANVGGWELDLATGSVYWTDQTCRIHGHSPGYQPTIDEAINHFAPDAIPVIQKLVDRAKTKGIGWDIELSLTRIDGEEIWVRSVGHVEFEQRKPLRLIGAFQNINERVKQRRALEFAHERISVATESGKIGVWDWNLQTCELTWTPQMFTLYGLPQEPNGRVSYELWRSLIHPDDREFAERVMQDSIAGSSSLETVFRILLPDGSIRFIQSSAKVKIDEHGKAIQVLGVNLDVTSLRNLSRKLAEQHELLQVTLQSIGDAVITSDSNGLITWLNPAAEHMTGWKSADASGKQLGQVFRIIDEDTRQPAENPVDACLRHGHAMNAINRTVLIACGGSEFGIKHSAAPIRSNSGELLGVVLVFHDVTEQRRHVKEMSYRATHDELTGLVNRSEFESRLQDTLDRSVDAHSEHALLYIDLDQFKLVNDTCGHAEGDQLLIQMAELLNHATRVGDTLARLGGDEFGVLLKDCSSVHAKKISQQICDKMDKYRFEHQKRRFRIGTSIGLVPFDKRWVNIESAMQAADTACYAAKEAGRNRVNVWSDSDGAMRARRKDMKWASRLEQALDNDNFVLFAQRIESSTAPDSALSAEVLVRLRDTDGKLIQPTAFLPAAERFNMATRLDCWILENSMRMLARSPDISEINTLFINLSGQSVGDHEFHKYAINLLTQWGRKFAQRICFEITETAAITNIAVATGFIDRVRALGVRIALDDFGAGASSFGYLKTLTVDILKIDGQFITGVIDDPLDAAAVRCFVDIAGAMNLQTVADCVESKAVINHLRTLGVDLLQGHYLHKPEPIEKLLSLNRDAKQTA